MTPRLTFGGYRLCPACSCGLHHDHTDIECMCDLCAQETPPVTLVRP